MQASQRLGAASTSARVSAPAHGPASRACPNVPSNRRGVACRNMLSKLFGGSSADKGKDASSGKESANSAPSTSGQTSLLDTMLRGEVSAPEYPPYTVIKRAKDYVLRLYDVFPIVEMQYERREEGYAALGGYFDGENASQAKFGYTQPIVMRYEPNGRKAMQMLVASEVQERKPSDSPTPAKPKSPSALPAPTDSSVRITVAGGELVAVYQFDGYITPATAANARKQLIAALNRDGLALGDDEANGVFRCAQYGAVYQPMGRLNELMLRVKP